MPLRPRRSPPRADPKRRAMPRPGAAAAGPFLIAGIGASAGGLEAVTALLKSLPPNPGLGFVLVQHLDPGRASALVSLLGRQTAMQVREAVEGMAVERNRIHVIPPNTVMRIRKGRLHLAPRGSGPTLPVDDFLVSLAADQGPRAIGVILSGSASDGVRGLEAIRAEGGITFAQSENTASFPGMPHSAVASGCVDFALPPAAIAERLAQLARRPSGAAGGAIPSSADGGDAVAAARIHGILRQATGVDFSAYKPTTIHRRIARRMSLHRQATLREYADLLERNTAEQEALFRDLLIPVTAFFRDPAVFRALESRVLPRLLHHRSPDDQVRVWVAGCASGEEAYSIAITVTEALARRRSHAPVLVLATDLSESALEKARAGVYPESIAADVPPALLRRYFTRLPAGYEIAGAIRKCCVFARHNLASDTPYSRLDLVACRNVLIYMEPGLQKRIFTQLHYALKPGGCLLLGSSESASAHAALFRPVDRHHRIYMRRDARGAMIMHATGPVPAFAAALRAGGPAGAADCEADSSREINRVLANRFTPAGVVVNDDLEILQFRGDTSAYLHPTPGRATLNLLRMVHDSLLHDLRRALKQAKRINAPVRRDGAWLRTARNTRRVDLQVVPLKATGLREPQYFVAFEESALPASPGSRRRGGRGPAADDTALATRLKLELASTKEYLQGVTEQHESAVEELRSANEEVLSSNEELQSANEELQTAQEEMQSANEELQTLNEEVQKRNHELNVVTHDLTSLLSSIELPIVLLDDRLIIRRFTPAAAALLSLTPGDVGRPILNLNLNLMPPDGRPGLEALMREAVTLRKNQEAEVQDRDEHWHALRLQQYRDGDHGPTGLVLSLRNIDAQRAAEAAERLRLSATEDELLRRETNLKMVFDQIPALVWTTNLALAVTSCLGSVPEAADPRPAGSALPSLKSLFGDDGEQAPWMAAHRRALAGEAAAFEYQRGGRSYAARVNPKIRHSSGLLAGTIGASHDVTEYKRLAQAKNDFISTVSHELRTPVTSIHGALRLLAARLNPEASPETRTLVELAARNSEMLARLVSDIVDLQKIEAGKLVLELKPVDLAALTRQAVEMTRPYGEQFGVTFEFGDARGAPPVKADPMLLTQVVTNLLSNAAKFSPRGAAVKVALEPRGSAVRVSIRNFGPPIPAEYHHRIFEKFGTVDASDTRLRGGTGLGLSICRAIVQRHGGTVDFTSDAERGTEFYFDLPANPARA